MAFQKRIAKNELPVGAAYQPKNQENLKTCCSTQIAKIIFRSVLFMLFLPDIDSVLPSAI